MGLKSQVKKQARELSQRAFEKLMSDESRAKQVAVALGTVQRGRKVLDKGQAQLMKALHFASQSDFKALSKKLAGLKRRVRDFEEKLDTLTRS